MKYRANKHGMNKKKIGESRFKFELVVLRKSGFTGF
jgi:hypothetical protein